jgi:hypothetical protein
MSTLGTWCGHACVCVCTYDSSSANLVEINFFWEKKEKERKINQFWKKRKIERKINYFEKRERKKILNFFFDFF